MKKANSSRRLYQRYRARIQKIADIKNALAVLQWDQETYLPVKGAALRAQQMATLASMAHGLSIDRKLGELLTTLAAQQGHSDTEKKNITLSLEDFNKQKKLPPSFIKHLSETAAKSFHAWVDAKKLNSFALYEPHLRKLVELKKKQAELLGYAGHPYDALLDEFEKGCTTGQLDRIFESIKDPLKGLLYQIAQKSQVEDQFLRQHFGKQEQWNFGLHLIKQIGFDFSSGRQDLSEHPFTTSFNVHDVRITTRINEENLSSMTWSCLHETGHALYEQGLPEGEYGLPSGEFTSLGIHESQSRLWENHVGRSMAFWQSQYPALQKAFPAQLDSISIDAFYKGINKVTPSFIRTEADELTYHFHVLIRYELEKLLIKGTLTVAEIPEYWNDQYKKYLGINVPDDRNGCLQDVHWSHGSFGYFPTYSLGSFYAAQLYWAATKDIPSLEADIQGGTTSPLLNWLRQRIYPSGRIFNTGELCKLATGQELEVGHFMSYLLDKYKKIYDF